MQAVARINRKKILLLILIIFFILFSIVINTCPAITLWDRVLITDIQQLLEKIPLWFPTAFDGELYAFMIIAPLLVLGGYFILKRKYFDAIYLGLVPLVTYGLSYVLKHFVARPRPPIELHLTVHPDGYSYVSNHTVISFCLWGIVIYYLLNYCENKFWRNAGIVLCVSWMFLIGFSRAWLGVHNPTDVIAAYLLGAILLIIYVRVRVFFEKYIGL